MAGHLRQLDRYPGTILVVGWLAPSATAGSHTRPFKASLVGEATFPVEANCPIGLRTHSDTTGTATHLGRTVMFADHCTPTGEEFGPDYMTLIAADGSELYFTDFGTAGPYPGPGTELGSLIFIDAEFEITGGTGRFEGATGEGEMTGYVVFVGFEVPNWPLGFVLEGSVTY